MFRRQKRSFWHDFRTFFVRGLVILLPSLLTLAILLWAYNFLKSNIAEPINWAVQRVVIQAVPQVYPNELDRPSWYLADRDEIIRRAPSSYRNYADLPTGQRRSITRQIRSEQLREYWRERWYLQGIGFVVAITAVYLAGVLVGNYLGRKLYVRFESWLIRIPIIKQVYPSVKQIVDFLIGEDTSSKLPTSGRVVLVEYPRMGIYTVGLLTGGTLKSIEKIAGEPSVTVFIPSSPTPFTGYTINLAASEVYPIDISFDEAIRFVVSAGVLVPVREQVEDSGRLPGDAEPEAGGQNGSDEADSDSGTARV
ncbi:DUF502 domain-containing protein [Phycisphaerales bacterium ac7]|nr:DUF502 domain-containing protein [bacterium]